MDRFQSLNLAVSLTLGFILYAFIIAKYHYEFETINFFISLFWAGLIAFFILKAYNDDDKRE